MHIEKKVQFYVINLDERRDRYDECLKEFEKHGLKNVKRLSAIKPKLKEIEKYKFLKRNKFTSKKRDDDNYFTAACGCKLSHYYIFKKALKEDSKKRYICILEDDVVFKDNFIENLSKSLRFIEKTKTEFDILYLQCNLRNLKSYKVQRLTEYLMKLKKGAASLSTTAQLFCVKNIKKSIKILENSKNEIDTTYQKYFEKRYCLYPMVAYQRDSYSDILKEEYKHPEYNPNIDEILKRNKILFPGK